MALAPLAAAIPPAVAITSAFPAIAVAAVITIIPAITVDGRNLDERLGDWSLSRPWERGNASIDGIANLSLTISIDHGKAFVRYRYRLGPLRGSVPNIRSASAPS